MSKTTSFILKAFMWVIGIASLGYGIYFLSVDTSNWPKVDAVVTSSKAVGTDSNDLTTYETYYEYTVDGAKYSDSIHDSFQYTEGDKITVYYDPKDPASTIMSQGEMGFTGCIGVFFGLFVIGSMAWGAIKARRKTGPPTAE